MKTSSPSLCQTTFAACLTVAMRIVLACLAVPCAVTSSQKKQGCWVDACMLKTTQICTRGVKRLGTKRTIIGGVAGIGFLKRIGTVAAITLAASVWQLFLNLRRTVLLLHKLVANGARVATRGAGAFPEIGNATA